MYGFLYIEKAVLPGFSNLDKCCFAPYNNQNVVFAA
jgi:hypothetical protein